MKTYEIDAREITYLTVCVEANTEAEALDLAKAKFMEGVCNYGDTELDKTSLYISGVFSDDLGECDICNKDYELTDNTTRCGECGNCGECCQHGKVKEND